MHLIKSKNYVLHFDAEINGVYSVNKINNNESIIIIDDESYIKDLSESTKLIILANAIELNEDILNSLKNKKINLLTTTDDINSIIKKIDLSNYVSEMAIDDAASFTKLCEEAKAALNA